MWEKSAWQLLELGGPVMWALLAASVLALALILDRGLAFLFSYQRFQRLIEQLRPLIQANDLGGVEDLCSRRRPLNQMVLAYLSCRDLPSRIRRDILQREGTIQLGSLETRLRWLAMIGKLSPMVGLLGTVTGMVTAFHQVQQMGGQVQPADLAAGIWQALLTTVFGLVIAIPCLAVHHLFESRLERLAGQFAMLVSYLDQWFAERDQKLRFGNKKRRRGREQPTEIS
ncbi:MAG: flagellar motor protein MotA [Gemmatales bacterium]|nr:MAG: flagellar motor protein MotA [Gemmatales bacterium]